jgi:hypothetical protein
MSRAPVDGIEAEFCTNSRCWMFKRGFVLPASCPEKGFQGNTFCKDDCTYLEVRKMPAKIRRQFKALQAYGGSR